jgi:enoyl-CoA hydratase
MALLALAPSGVNWIRPLHRMPVLENGPLALIASKAIIRDSHTWSNEEMWQKQAAYIAPVFTSSDAREGAAAFAEKRKPNWQGK